MPPLALPSRNKQDSIDDETEDMSEAKLQLWPYLLPTHRYTRTHRVACRAHTAIQLYSYTHVY